MADRLPKRLFYVMVCDGEEVVHERAFTHELDAQEWGNDFGQRFEVFMGSYALAAFPEGAVRPVGPGRAAWEKG